MNRCLITVWGWSLQPRAKKKPAWLRPSGLRPRRLTLRRTTRNRRVVPRLVIRQIQIKINSGNRRAVNPCRLPQYTRHARHSGERKASWLMSAKWKWSFTAKRPQTILGVPTHVLIAPEGPTDFPIADLMDEPALLRPTRRLAAPRWPGRPGLPSTRPPRRPRPRPRADPRLPVRPLRPRFQRLD